MDPVLPQQLCTGGEYRTTLTVAGGNASYVFEQLRTFSALTVTKTSPNTADVIVKPSEAGTYAAIAISDGQNAATQVTFAISQTPRVVTTTLKSACLGEVYRESLVATGGGNYEWSGDVPAALGLTLSSDGKLEGGVKSTGAFAFDVTVRDKTSGCVSAKQRVVLEVLGTSHVDCPRISVKGRPSYFPAPPSCRAQGYSAAFEAIGGEQPYTWSATGTPSGLTFAGLTQTLSGMPTAAGDFTVQVTDKKGRTVERSFPIPVRDKCWLGFVTTDSGPARLQIFDPLLGSRLQRPSGTDASIVVQDFKFSPDGKFVAYRVKDALGVSTLHLWQGPGWDRDAVIPLDGSVLHYAWSPDGKTLAAAYKGANGTLLGGVSVAAVSEPPTTSGIQGLRPLKPVAANVDSEIYWYGDSEYVAFHSREAPPSSQRGFDYSRYTGEFSSSSDLSATYPPNLVVYPSSVGLFATGTNISAPVFYGAGATYPVYHGDVAISPSGAFAGTTLDGVLRVFRAQDWSADEEDIAFVESPDCSALLTWNGREQSLCIDGAANTLSLRNLNLSATPPSIERVVVANAESYASGTWSGSRRLISPSGSWAAMSTPGKIYLADLRGVAPAMARAVSLPSGSEPVNLGFSPDEKFVFFQKGSQVWLIDTRVSGGDGFLFATLPEELAVLGCQEEQRSFPSWCGRADENLALSWSTDSRVTAYVSSVGALVAADMRLLASDGYVDKPIATQNCAGGCVGGFRFQP
jgi:WD40 repeat protein